MEQWGVFALESEVDLTKQQLEEAGLEVFEIRQISGFEKLLYFQSISTDIEVFIVMFNATREEYEAFVNRESLLEIF